METTLADPYDALASVLADAGASMWHGQYRAADASMNHRVTLNQGGHKTGMTFAAAIVALAKARMGRRVVLVSDTPSRLVAILDRQVGLLGRAHHLATLREGMAHASTPGDVREFRGLDNAPVFVVDNASRVDLAVLHEIADCGYEVSMFDTAPARPVDETISPFSSALVTTASSDSVPAGILGLATRDWVYEMREQLGPNSALYSQKVLGRFRSKESAK